MVCHIMGEIKMPTGYTNQPVVWSVKCLLANLNHGHGYRQAIFNRITPPTDSLPGVKF